MEHNIASVQNASASRRNSKTSEKLLGDQSISLPIDSNEEQRSPSPTTSKCIMISIGLGITAILVITTIYATVSSMNAKGKARKFSKGVAKCSLNTRWRSKLLQVSYT